MRLCEHHDGGGGKRNVIIEVKEREGWRCWRCSGDEWRTSNKIRGLHGEEKVSQTVRM